MDAFSLENMQFMAIGLLLLAAITIISRSILSGWREWLDLKRAQLASHEAMARNGRAMDCHAPETRADPASNHAMTRIELADMRERLRKLEAIAAGVDL